MMEERYQELKSAEKGAIVSIFSYIFLSTVKIIIGKYTHSEALIADGWNNFTDILASFAIFIGLRLARRPPDDDHKYGHWKIETVSSMITSFIMLAIGLEVLTSSIKTFFVPQKQTPEPLAAVISLGSALLMMLVYIYNKSLAKKVKSGALMAAAKDNISDARVSIGAALAIFTAQFQMPWLDTLAAMIISALILKTAIEIFLESAFSLSDGFPEEQLHIYQEAVSKIPGVCGVGPIRGRTYGANIFLDIVLYMDPKLTVQQSHDITEQVEFLLKKEYDVFDIDIHVEPFSSTTERM